MSPFTKHPEELISASLSGDLTPVERRELDAHLDRCASCRATLDAFREQRQLLSRMPQPPLPRDLEARVRGAVESGRLGRPWWRRPGGILAGVASLATVGAAALLALFVLNGPSGPNIGHQTPSPSATGVASVTPSTAPTSATPGPIVTPAPLPLGMQPGDMLYLHLTGASDALQLSVVLAQDGTSLTLRNPASGQFGAVDRAALSPDGRLLAFASDTGLKGTTRIFVANLADGSTQQLAETLPLAFGRRLAWSPDGRYLAFTVAAVDGAGSSDVWLYDRTADRAARLTNAGNAYFASWARPVASNEQLWVSLGEARPVSQLAQFPVDGGLPASDPLAGEATTIGGVFAPLVSPDGTRVLYWNGTMALDGTSGWIFSKGGMPQVAAYDGHWSGSPLFRDLVVGPNGGAFASGELTWADDSDTCAVWDASWTGTPEGSGYPDVNAVYVGRLSAGELSQGSALDLGSMSSASGDPLSVAAVTLASNGGDAAVTLRVPLPGDTSPPASYLRLIPTAGGSPTDVGSGGQSPPPWSGPGAFVPALAGS